MKRFIYLITIALFTISVQAQGYKPGDMASDFRLKNIDGSYVSLSDYSAQKGVIVIFTCNHCPFSIAYEDRIIALDKKYKPLGFPVVAINPNDPAEVPADSYEQMQIRAREKGFTFPYLFDEGQKVYPVYGAVRTPHVFLLSHTDDGFRVAYIGAIDDNSQDASAVTKSYVEDAIRNLLAGSEPDVAFTKAIGCSIKSQAK